MKLFNTFNKNGLYVAATLTEQTKLNLLEFMNINDVPNRPELDDLHITIQYSREYVDYVLNNDSVNIGKDNHLDVFEYNGKRYLVLVLDSAYLQHRHEYGRLIGCTYDHDEYKPHITLSKDLGLIDYVPVKTSTDFDIIISHEYKEDLEL